MTDERPSTKRRLATRSNVEDSSGLGLLTFWSNRSQEVRAAIAYMLNSGSGRSRLDPTRIGAFGFSAGGFTVLTVAGGRPDLGLVTSRCASTPEFVCEVLRAANSPLLRDIAPTQRVQLPAPASIG